MEAAHSRGEAFSGVTDVLPDTLMLYMLIISLLTCTMPSASHGTEISREIVDLSGNWEYVAVVRLGDIPPEGTWGTTYVGTASGVDYPVSGQAMLPWDRTGKDYWYRTSATIPASWSGRAIRLRFASVQQTCRIYINGKLVAANSEGYVPFEVDITDHVRLGASNELLVGVLDGRSAAIPSQVAKWFVGIRDKVQLVGYASVRISDVFIKTSVRRMSLGMEVTLKNESSSPLSVKLNHAVYDDAVLVKGLPSSDISVAADAETVITLDEAWATPIFWCPDNPKLYTLKSEVLRNGSVIDTISTRFGFREFWNEGSVFYLNGTKIRPRANFCSQWPDEQGFFFTYAEKHGMATADAYLKCMADGTFWNAWKNLNVNCIRLMGGGRPDLLLDSADSHGMMVVYENVLCSYPDANATPTQQEACLRHAETVVHHLRNHPSIIMWSGGNEQFGNCAITKNICMRQIDVIRATDPTRLVLNSGFWDEPTVGGKALVYDLHYPMSLTRGVPSWGSFPDVPNHFYWMVDHSLPIWSQIDIGPGLPTSPTPPHFKWNKDKPLLCGESLAGVGEWTAGLHGDGYYLTDWPHIPHYWQISQCTLPLEIMCAESYRLCGVSAITTFGMWLSQMPSEFYRQLSKFVLSPMGIFIREYDNNFFGNTRVTRDIVIWNDSYTAKTLVASYEVKLDTNVLLSARKTVSVGPAETLSIPVTFVTPSVSCRRKMTVRLSLSDGFKSVYDRDYLWDVFPDRPGIITPTSRRFALYDPLSQTGPVLTKAGALFDLINDFNDLSDWKTLVFGMNAFSHLSSAELAADQVRAFVQSGGSVVVFEQDDIPAGLLPINVRPVAKDQWPAHSICWTKQGDRHPVLSGLECDDIQYWNGDNIVSSRMMVKPDAGNLRILAEAGYDERGLYRTPLLEMPYGQGTYLVSQLDITSKYDAEPVARILVKNMLEYSLTASRVVAEVGMLADPQSTFGKALTRTLGVSGDFIDISSISGYDTLLIDGTTLASLDGAAVRSFASNGGTVILHGVTPACESKLAEIFGGSVSITQQSLSSPTKIVNEPLTGGLGSYNLYWVTPWEHPDAIQQFITSGLAYSVKAPCLEPLTSNSGLSLAELGRGRVIVDQYLWETQAGTNNANKALNYISTLFTNLGIPMDVSDVRVGMPNKKRPQE